MKIRLEIDGSFDDEEIVIRCKTLTEEIKRIERTLIKEAGSPCIPFYKDGAEFFIPLEDVLFFESDNGSVFAHTAKDMYKVKSALYTLEDVLPGCFVRASKSAIINVDRICSVERNITSFSTIGFFGTHKKIFASRNHIKNLMQRLNERRNVL